MIRYERTHDVCLAGSARGGMLRLLLALTVLSIYLVLSACSTPGGAPVLSRESSHGKEANRTPAYYRVRKGDTLYSISWRFGLDYHNLARWNGIRPPYVIYPGQRLRVRASANRVQRRQPTINPAEPKEIQTSGNKPVQPVKPQPGQRQSQPQPQPRPVTAPPGNTGGSNGALTWRWPTRGRVIQQFVPGDPLRKGIRISGQKGQAVTAAEAGRVVYAGSGLIGYGRLVIVKHDKTFLSAYGNNSQILVKEGDQVSAGMKIARMGTDSAGTPGLHFEIRRNGTPINPVKLLPRSH